MELILDQLREYLHAVIIAMHEEDTVRRLLVGTDPVHEAELIRMARHIGHLRDLRLHRHLLTEELHVIGTIHQRPAQRALRLVAGENDGRLRTPEIVLDVMADTTRIAHAGGRDDHLRRLVKVDGLRLLERDGEVQPAEGNRVDALIHDGTRLIIIALIEILREDMRRIDRQRTVDIDREVVMPDDEMLLFDLTEKVQQLLRTTHRKCRHNDIAAPIEGPLRDVHEILQMVDRRIMET